MKDQKEIAQTRITVPITTDRANFYSIYLKSIKGLLGELTDREIEIISEFCIVIHKLQDSELSEEEKNQIIFSTTTRKNIQNKLGISAQNFNNYMMSLTEKGALIYDKSTNTYTLRQAFYRSIKDVNKVTMEIVYNIVD